MISSVFSANMQPIDLFGALLKPLLPFLLIAAIIKILSQFVPKKRRKAKTPRLKPSRPSHHGSDESKVIAIGAMGIFLGLLFSKVVLLLSCVLFALGLYLIWIKKHKGRFGEMLVSSRLGNGLPKSEYEILNNIYLPIDDGSTTQIDHVVVSRFGLFVVETKNYTGWIFADASSRVWTQTIYNTKNTFQNPIRQNYRHVCAIADNLGIPKEYIRSVVAFTGDCEFKTPMPEGVVYSRKLADYIKSFATPILRERKKAEIAAALREWDASVTPDQRSAHVNNLRRWHN